MLSFLIIKFLIFFIYDLYSSCIEASQYTDHRITHIDMFCSKYIPIGIIIILYWRFVILHD